jgi:hypothetical protein
MSRSPLRRLISTAGELVKVEFAPPSSHEPKAPFTRAVRALAFVPKSFSSTSAIELNLLNG